MYGCVVCVFECWVCVCVGECVGVSVGLCLCVGMCVGVGGGGGG